jgi:hypothetical protein
MNTWLLRWAGRFTRGWARVYTVGLPARCARERRDEIASDLWEHATDEARSGSNAGATATEIFGRAVLGMPADLSWHLDELRGESMAFPTPRLTALLWIGVGLLSIVLAAGLLTALASGDWQIDDDASIVAFFGIFGVLAGIVGPFVALGGLYVLRRAQAERRSLTPARTLLIAGTGGIALFGVSVWWTIVGLAVAVGIAIYWARKLGDWRDEHPQIG